MLGEIIYYQLLVHNTEKIASLRSQWRCVEP